MFYDIAQNFNIEVYINHLKVFCSKSFILNNLKVFFSKNYKLHDLEKAE